MVSKLLIIKLCSFVFNVLLVEIIQHSYYNITMNYSFEYIDIILLAMIAGFIFLRLRGILGKRTGFEGKTPAQFKSNK